MALLSRLGYRCARGVSRYVAAAAVVTFRAQPVPRGAQLSVIAHHYMYDRDCSKLSRTALFLVFGSTVKIYDGAFWSSSDDQDWTLMAWSD
jgi:hypothetical protein